MEPDFIKQLALTIRQYRKKSGLTQQELAQLAGIGKTAVFDLEHGKGTAQLDTVLNILKVLNIQLNITGPLAENK